MKTYISFLPGPLATLIDYVMNNDWVTWALLLVLPPLGIWLLWRRGMLNRNGRLMFSLLSAIWLVAILLLIFVRPQNPDEEIMPQTIARQNPQETVEPTATPVPEVSDADAVYTVGDGAFYQCEALTSVTLPTSLKNVEWTAFSATGIQSITIPESNTFNTLTDKLFFQCRNLKDVTIPVTITKIADDTFSECSKDLTIHAYSGSYAASYASSHNIKLEESARGNAEEAPQDYEEYYE